MAHSWNWSAPGALGPEWQITGGSLSTLRKTPVRALLMPATQAETVEAFSLRIADSGVTGPRFTSLVEVFELGDELLLGQTTFTARPNEDEPTGSNIGAAGWTTQAGGTANLWATIDEPAVWPPSASSAADYIYTDDGVPRGFNFHVDVAAFPAGARIARIRATAVVAASPNPGPYRTLPFAFRLYYVPTGGHFTPPGARISAGYYSNPVALNFGEINPVTALPWTLADLAEFGPGGDWACRVEASGTPEVDAKLISYELLVDYYPVENRVAVASWERPAVQASGLITTGGAISLPSGAAGWAKPSSGEFVYTWRIANDMLLHLDTPGATTHWETGYQRLVAGDPEHPGNGIKADTSSVSPYGNLYTEMAWDDDQVPNLGLIVAGAPSGDSQPYSQPSLAPTMFLAATPGTYAGQRYTPAANGSYVGLKVPLLPPQDATGDSTLTATVHRVSDGVQMGGSLAVTLAEARALPPIEQAPQSFTPGQMVLLTGFLSSAAALVAGTQYELRLTITGTAGHVWRVPRANATGMSARSYGGTTDSAYTSAGASTDDDIGALLLIAPPVPLNVNAEVFETPTRLGTDCFCGVRAVEHVMFRWQQPAITGFDRAEIERYLDIGDADDEWRLVAIDRMARDHWVDREVPRGVPVKYRIRNFTTTGAFSDYVESGWVTPQAKGSEVIITSNVSPDLTVVYQHEPVVSYDMLDFAADRLVPIDGADYHVVLRETEDRGIAHTMRVIVNFGRKPCDDRGRPMGKDRLFRPLRNAARWPDTPYVCVLDSDSNRWLAHMDLGRGQSMGAGWRYYIDATVTPITRTPAVVEIP